jgi:hypothetical protein
MNQRERPLSFRATALAFLLILAATVVGAAGLLVLLDPRAQAFWLSRFEEVAAAVRGLFGR